MGSNVPNWSSTSRRFSAAELDVGQSEGCTQFLPLSDLLDGQINAQESAVRVGIGQGDQVAAAGTAQLQHAATVSPWIGPAASPPPLDGPDGRRGTAGWDTGTRRSSCGCQARVASGESNTGVRIGQEGSSKRTQKTSRLEPPDRQRLRSAVEVGFDPAAAFRAPARRFGRLDHRRDEDPGRGKRSQTKGMTLSRPPIYSSAWRARKPGGV